MPNPIDYICTYCNSSEGVVWDAYANWDSDKQKMVLDSTYDQCECCTCGSTIIEEVPYKESEVSDAESLRKR